jgi:Secretion system C-terminal sorting domain
MKKIIILTVILSLSQICFTQNQTTLTISESYDFAIGDTFQYAVKNPLRYLNGRTEQIVILDKWYSLNKDTVFYKQNYERYGVDYGVQIVKDYERKEQIVSYTHLDSTVNYNISRVNCPKIESLNHFCRDSVYKAYGQHKTYLFNNEIMLFAGQKRIFSQGLGMTLIENRSEDASLNNSKTLVYFHKGNEIWGEPKPIISSDKGPSVFYDKIRVLPNPVKDVLNIETDIDVNKVLITNLNGQVVLQESRKSLINVSSLPNGLYFLQIYDNSTLKSVRKIIVTH